MTNIGKLDGQNPLFEGTKFTAKLSKEKPQENESVFSAKLSKENPKTSEIKEADSALLEKVQEAYDSINDNEIVDKVKNFGEQTVFKLSRTQEFGKEIEDLSLSERADFEKAKAEAEAEKERRSHYMNYVISNNDISKEIEPGVIQTKYGDWTETKIQLYDGKTYNQLSKEDKAKLDEWKNECEKMEEVWGKDAKMPDCPFEQSAEIRAEKEETSSFLPRGEKVEIDMCPTFKLPDLTEIESGKTENDGILSKIKPSDIFDSVLGKMAPGLTIEGLETEKHGKKLEDAPKELLDEYNAKLNDSEYLKENATPYTEFADGTKRRALGDGLIETTIPLYNGTYYELLSEEDAQKIDEWKKECEVISLENKFNNVQNELPPCPLETSNEIRIRRSEDGMMG